jgi:hypothetical protein
MRDGSLLLETAEGDRYAFDVRWMSDPLPNVPAVYAVSRRQRRPDGGWSHKVVYLGQTDDLAQRIARHSGNALFDLHDAQAVAFLEVPELQRRRAIRDALLDANGPLYGDREVAEADSGLSNLIAWRMTAL